MVQGDGLDRRKERLESEIQDVSKLGHLECVWLFLLYALPCGLSLNLSVWGGVPKPKRVSELPAQ